MIKSNESDKNNKERINEPYSTRTYPTPGSGKNWDFFREMLHPKIQIKFQLCLIKIDVAAIAGNKSSQ